MEYMPALEREIVTESLISNIDEKVKVIIKFVVGLIQRAIEILTDIISKCKKNKNKENDNDFKNYKIIDKNGNEIPYNDDIEAKIQKSIKINVYNCGKEMTNVIDEIQFCIEKLCQRPTPNHKLGKGYAERWAGDNEFIIERMAKASEILDKLEAIEDKELKLEDAEVLRDRLQKLRAQYDKYYRIYDMYSKKNPHTEEYLITTMAAFNVIADVSNRSMQIFPELQS